MDLSKYIKLFLDESSEHVRTLDRLIVGLEKSANPEADLQECFRAAHSIKGMASSMGFQPVTECAHAMEDLLADLRSKTIVISESLIDLLLVGKDLLEKMVGAVETESEIPGAQDFVAKIRAVCSSQATQNTTPVVLEVADKQEEASASDLLANRCIRIVVTISQKSNIAAARGFLIHRKMSAAFTVLKVIPPIERIKKGDFNRQIEFWLDNAEGSINAEKIRQALAGVSDVEAIHLSDEGADASKGTRAPGFDEFVRPKDAVSIPVRTGMRAQVKVTADFIEQVINDAGELLISSLRLQNLALETDASFAVTTQIREMHKQLRAHHEKVLSVRMTSIDFIAEKLPRIVRDLARQLHKKIRLEVTGSDILVDRSILEELDAPILHLIRNAADHGMETPEERARLGKEPEGRVFLRASMNQGQISLEIGDDGKGMDADALKKHAVEKNILSSVEAQAMSREDALRLCLLPGFSTAGQVTEISGRGVGMDAVQKLVERLGGALSIDSEKDRGTTFKITFPLNVSVSNVLLFNVSGQTFGFPLTKIERALEIPAKNLRQEAGKTVFNYQDRQIEYRIMGKTLGLEGLEKSAQPTGNILPVILISQTGESVGMGVDCFTGMQEVVLKPLSRTLKQIGMISGVTVLGDGKPTFILDPKDVVEHEIQ